MLCPECKRSVAGGAVCPQCLRQVPEQEDFDGEGGRYLLVLSLFSLAMLLVLSVFASLGMGLRATIIELYHKGWIWLLAVVLLIPIGIGLHYWFMLREEEITVTDERITRRSRWGNESLAWSQIKAFRCRSVPLSRTRIGRLAWLSRFFGGRQSPNFSPRVYELIGPPGPDGEAPRMYLEPGTIDELPWLIELIEEHLGPPTEYLGL